jgi:hypothetical protein
MKKPYGMVLPFFLILFTSLFIDGCRQKPNDDEGSQSAAKAMHCEKKKHMHRLPDV